MHHKKLQLDLCLGGKCFDFVLLCIKPQFLQFLNYMICVICEEHLPLTSPKNSDFQLGSRIHCHAVSDLSSLLCIIRLFNTHYLHLLLKPSVIPCSVAAIRNVKSLVNSAKNENAEYANLQSEIEHVKAGL